MRGHGTCSAMTVSIPLDSTPLTGKTVEDSLILTIMADNKKIEIVYSSSKDAAVALGGSPFKDDTVVVLTGHTTACIKQAGKEVPGKSFLVFMTNVGPLWPSMLTKGKVDADGGIHRADKAFKDLADEVAKAILSEQSDVKALEKVVAAHNKEGFKIVRDEFPAKTADGRPYVGAIIDATKVSLSEEDYKKSSKWARSSRRLLTKPMTRQMATHSCQSETAI